MINYDVINNLVYKKLHKINKSVIKSNEIFDLINKFDDITLYENDNVVDL